MVIRIKHFDVRPRLSPARRRFSWQLLHFQPRTSQPKKPPGKH